MKITLTHKILLVVAIPLAIQLIFIAIMSNDLSKLAAAQNREQHFVKVVMARDRFIINERQRTLYLGMYVSTLDDGCRQKYFETRSDTAGVFNELANLWSGDAERSRILRQFWQLFSFRDEGTHALLQHFERRTTVDEMLSGASASTVFLRHFVLIKKVPFLEPLFVKDQEQKVRETEAVVQNTNLIYVSLFIGLGALLLASLLSGLLFSFSVSRRLKIVLSNIDALANHQASLVNIKGGDEISMLNAAVVNTATKIRDAEEFQAQTIAIIAEELNKPLTEVDAALQELQKNGFETLSDKGAKRLHDSSAEIRRLESLVFELVNLDAAGRKLDIVQVDLAEMATNCLKIVEPLTKLKSISIKLDSGTNSIAFADGEKTTQVLINLLSNAIKYSPENSTIEVVISSTEQEVKVSVSDQGPGIPKEFHSKIFQRYEQAEAAGAQKAASSGLGLKISKEIVESQRGSVGFASKEGEGSTFWFSLPTTRQELTGAIQEHSVNRGWKATLWKKALLVVALPIMVQLITISALFNFLHQNSEKIAELEKIPQITSLHEKLMTGIAGAGFLALMYNNYRAPGDLVSVRAEDVALRKNIAELERLTANDKETGRSTAKLLAAINAHIAFDEHLIHAKQNANFSMILGVKGTDKKENLLIDTHGPLQELIARQNELMASNALASEEIRHNFEMLLFASAIAASIVAAALGLLIAKSLTSRAQRLAKVALQFSDHRQLPEPLAGDDELAFVEQQLYIAGKKLMELEVLRTEMIGVTSHELRTPLTSLIALIELIEADVFGTVTEQGEKLLATARLETSELIVLITNLLDLEKMESGKILVMKQKMRVESVFDQIQSDNVQSAHNKGISLTIQKCEQEIFGDSGRLSQALTAIIRSILERIPTKSDVLLECKKSHNNVILALEAPHGVAVKGYNNKHREFAREQMAISLARLTALQHGGNLHLITSSKGRTIEISLPIGA
jgi:signal transduction histidine kinase